MPLPSTGLDVASLLVPRPGHTLGISWLAHAAAEPHPISAGGYIGVPLLVLVILLAVAGWSSKLVRFLTCMLAVIIVAAIGPVLYFEGQTVTRLPWAGLYDLPLVRNAYPARLMLFAFLALAVATSLFLAGRAGLADRSGLAGRAGRAEPADRAGQDGSAEPAAGASGSSEPRLASWALRPALRWSLAVLVLAAIAADSPPIHVRTVSSVPTYISSGLYKRSSTPGEIVIILSRVRNAGMLWQAQSGFAVRLAGGFINSGFSAHSDQPRVVRNLQHPTPADVARFEAYIKASGVGAIWVDLMHAQRLARIFAQIGLVGHRDGNVEIFQTDRCQACRPLTQAQIDNPPQGSF